MSDMTQLERLFVEKRRLDAQAFVPGEAARGLRELRAWQASRLARTYQDLSRDPRCTAAVEFFLTDLYGPQNFERRDADFARAWKRLKRGLPDAALEVLARALELQVSSAQLDQAMVEELAGVAVNETTYAKAYRAVGRAEARQRQIDLAVGIGTDLARLVSFPLIGLALRAAHIPAHLAGLGALQDFLERGYGAFRRLEDPGVLLEAIRMRETDLMRALFSGSHDPFHLDTARESK